MEEEKLTFLRRDFLYDNGLVTLLRYLKQHPESMENERENEVQVTVNQLRLRLLDDRLEISAPTPDDLWELYLLLRSKYYENVFIETDNKRAYYDPQTGEPIIRNKLSVYPFLARNERVKDLLVRAKIPIEQYRELEAKVKQLKKDEGQEKFEDKILYGKIKGKDVKEVPVVVFYPKEIMARRLAEQISSTDDDPENPCVACGSTKTIFIDAEGKKKVIDLMSTNNPFMYGISDAEGLFRDQRISRGREPLCYWCDLIYRAGMTYTFYMQNRAYLFYTSKLTDLYKLKSDLLPNSHEPRREILEETNIKSNFLQVPKIPTTGSHVQLLELMRQFSENDDIYQQLTGEEVNDEPRGDYSGATDDDFAFQLYEEQALATVLISFTVDSTGIKEGIVFDKFTYMLRILRAMRKHWQVPRQALIEEDEEDDEENEGIGSFDDFLATLIKYHYNEDGKEIKSKIYYQEELARCILEQHDVAPVLLEMSYYHLRKEGTTRGKTKTRFLSKKKLARFMILYLEVLKTSEELKRIHEICKELGSQIGRFAAGSKGGEGRKSYPENKSLVFQVREIGNMQQLSEFFKNFSYEVAKEDVGFILNEKSKTLDKSYAELIEVLITYSIEHPKDIPVIRNFLGVYAVQQFLRSKYAQEKQKNQKK